MSRNGNRDTSTSFWRSADHIETSPIHSRTDETDAFRKNRDAAMSLAAFGTNDPDTTPLSPRQVNAKRALIIGGLLFMVQNPQFAALALGTLLQLVRDNVAQAATDANMTEEEYLNTEKGYAFYVWQSFFNYVLQYICSLSLNIMLSLSMEFVYIAIKHPRRGLAWYNNKFANVILLLNFFFWPVSGLVMGILAARPLEPQSLCIEPLYTQTEQDLYGMMASFASQGKFWFGKSPYQIFSLLASILGCYVMMITSMFKRITDMQLAFLTWSSIIKLDKDDQSRIMNACYALFSRRHSATTRAHYVLNVLVSPDLPNKLENYATLNGVDSEIIKIAEKSLNEGSKAEQVILNMFHCLWVLTENIINVASFLLAIELSAQFLSDSMGETLGRTVAFLASFAMLISLESFANAAAEPHAFAVAAFFRALGLAMQGKTREAKIVFKQSWLLLLTIPTAFFSGVTTTAATSYNAKLSSEQLGASPRETATNILLAQIATGDFNGIGAIRSGITFLQWLMSICKKEKKGDSIKKSYDTHTYAYDLVTVKGHTLGQDLANSANLNQQDILKLAGMHSLITLLSIITLLGCAFAGLTATGEAPVKLNHTVNVITENCYAFINGNHSFETLQFVENTTSFWYLQTNSTVRPQIDEFFDLRALWYPILSSLQMALFAVYGLNQHSHGFKRDYLPYAVVNTLIALVPATAALMLMNRLSSYVTGDDFGPLPKDSGICGKISNALFAIIGYWVIGPVMNLSFAECLLPKTNPIGDDRDGLDSYRQLNTPENNKKAITIFHESKDDSQDRVITSNSK